VRSISPRSFYVIEWDRVSGAPLVLRAALMASDWRMEPTSSADCEPREATGLVLMKNTRPMVARVAWRAPIRGQKVTIPGMFVDFPGSERGHAARVSRT